MIYIFLSITLLLFLSDSYIVLGVMKNVSWWWKALFLLPTLSYCIVVLRMLAFGDVRQFMLNLLFWLTLCIVFPTVLFTLLSLLGKVLGIIWNPAGTVFNAAALIVSAAWLSVALYGITAGWKKITSESIAISSAKIPQSFDGYRIVQLSDFHIGTYSGSPHTVERIVDEVNGLNPDLIVFTGDLVNSTSEELIPFSDVLGRLKAKDGIISVLGNHDYCLYRNYEAPDSPEKELAKVTECEEKIGWRLLRNEHQVITKGDDSIAVIGVENAGSRMFPDKSDLPRALKGLSDSGYKILLSHDPSHWRREVLPDTDIDLTLSGHTHAMQFRIGNWSPSKWSYPEWGGLYEYNNQKLYVSTGIGENIAFRFGAYPQIVLITLKSMN